MEFSYLHFVLSASENSTEEKVTISKAEYEDLKFQLAQLKRMIFGTKSEKFVPVDDAQISLFETPATEPEEKTEEITYSRKIGSSQNNKPVRTELPAHLPRLKQVIEPDPIPEGAQKIGEEITEQLEYKPAKIYVHQIVRPKYVVKDKGIYCADMPTQPIPRSNAGPGLLAHLIVSKFVDHLPFYRQSKMFAREGITLAESTIGGWFAKSCELLDPLYEKMKGELLQSGYIQADETPIKVLDPSKKKATNRGYHWVYHDPVKKLVVFDYRKGRSREGPNEFLGHFTGILQTDGYKVYDDLKIKHRIIHAGCMAHVRRKFFEAKDSDPKRCEYVLEKIKELYAVEKTITEKNLMDHKQVMDERQVSVDTLSQLKEWLDDEIVKVRPKSPVGKAIAYTLSQWPKLLVYTGHPQMKIDNNLIENTIRPVALGRKNYLFAGSHDGAKRAAMIYSFLGTCKLNNVNPWQWLNHVLSVIPDHKASQLHELFPQNCVFKENLEEL